jgi:hypothetical protein
MTQLTLPQRAQVALGTAEHEKNLIALVKESERIIEVKNGAGRDECHSAMMKLKGARVAIDKVGKKAREDAVSFRDAVIEEAKRLIAITEPEETRLQSLRDAWDEKVKAEKEAKANADKIRLEKIQRLINNLRDYPRTIQMSDPASLSKTLKAAIAEFDGWVPHVDDYAEFVPVAAQTIADSLAQMKVMLAAEIEREAAAAQAEIERAELAKLRAEAAERAQKDRDEAIAKAAVESAKAEAAALVELEALKARQAVEAAEKKIKDERDAADQREAKLKQDAADAEQRRIDDQKAAEQAKIDAAIKAEEDQKRAVQAEQERVAELARQVESDRAKREANKAHLSKINRAALAAMIEGGIAEDCAKAVIKLIASGKIPAVQINY